MTGLKTNKLIALRLLMTDDLFLIKEKADQHHFAEEDLAPESDSYNYLGENNKYLLIMVNDAAQEIISPEDLIMLTAILKAKQLELRDVAIVNWNQYQGSDFDNLKRFFACKKLILFGINPGPLGLKDIGSNRVDLFKGTKILATYSFDEMKNDDAKKRLFWNEMKGL